MSLSPLLQDLKAQEQAYEASEATKEKLTGKILTTLVAPTAVGKSTIISRALELASDDFSEAYSITTRPRRASDPAGYKTADEGYDIARVAQMIQARELTHYVVHPNGQIYCSLPESYPTRYNLLPCVPNILSVVKRAGFSTVHTIYIVTTAGEWAARLPARRRDPSYASRLGEAVESLSWAIAHAKELTFVENAAGQLDQAAQAILDITRGQATEASRERGVSLAKDMLGFARHELESLNSQ